MIWLKNIRNVSFIVFVFERVRKIQMGSFQADVIALWSRKRSEHVQHQLYYTVALRSEMQPEIQRAKLHFVSYLKANYHQGNCGVIQL